MVSASKDLKTHFPSKNTFYYVSQYDDERLFGSYVFILTSQFSPKKDDRLHLITHAEKGVPSNSDIPFLMI